jgi:hypothetical protein
MEIMFLTPDSLALYVRMLDILANTIMVVALEQSLRSLL